MIMSLEQRKIKIKPRIKLNYNMYTYRLNHNKDYSNDDHHDGF